MNKQQFLEAIIQAAVQDEQRNGIPALATVAQAIHESNWGQSTLAQKANNLFGVKATKSWKGDILVLPTREYLNGQWVTVQASWRSYKTLSECLDDRMNFLRANQRYKAALEYLKGDFASAIPFLTHIWKAGWATDPQYVQKIQKLIDQNQLDGRVGNARARQWAAAPKRHWAQDAVDRLLHNEIIANGDRLDEPMTRGEAFAVADAILRNKGHIYTTNLGKE